MNEDFFYTLLLTGKLAGITTSILLLAGLPLAWWLAHTKYRVRVVVETLVSMPMVLPPTVMGYYLLVAMSPQSPAGAFFEQFFDTRLAFSFNGIVIASVIANLPFMIQPLQNGFSSLPAGYREAAYTMGKSKRVTFLRVLLPNIKASLVTGVALTFAHCIGEFGIVVMVGGNIPKETRIASVAIYDQVQALDFEAANSYALILFIISFLMLLLIYSVNRKFRINFYK